MKFSLYIFIGVLFLNTSWSQTAAHTVKHLKITVLSTMLAQKGIGEWGFAALVEADSNLILFDTGAHDSTVLQNARVLNIDLSKVPTLILSHNHDDHTTGWLPLRNVLLASNPEALAITEAGSGIFDTRIDENGNPDKSFWNDSLKYAQTGGQVKLFSSFSEIYPGVYVTGPIPRRFPEKNFLPHQQKLDARGNRVEDNLPEDMSLVIATTKGLVLLSGCGHAGVINTVTLTREKLPGQNLLAAIGGFHLFMNTDEQIRWTSEKLKEAGIRYFMGAHCTGIEAVYQIRNWTGLKRGECIVGSVGDSFDPDKGFQAGALTR
jgi:7,8-dihydropterin-6-yl-methyl-4-(beta-D-ribofuranosyl)aminobenzene 5'-phosphate synthase